jgi:hypothetical protein
MRVSLFSTAILLFTLFAAGGSVLACDCFTPSKAERLKHADVAFEGEVVEILYSKEHPKLPIGYKFAVSETLKGEAATEITILREGTNCDADFTLGSAYRVYARRYEGKLISGQCSGNELLNRKKARGAGAQSYARANFCL